MNLSNPNYISAYFQAHIYPQSIPLIMAVTKNDKECEIINIKMRRDPASATSKTYNLKFPTFENVKPE